MAKNTEKITIKIEGEEWQKALDKTFKKKQKDVKIDGFRKGAVPKEVYYEKVGIESLYMDSLNDLAGSALQKAFKVAKIKPIIDPDMEVIDVNKDYATYEITFIGKPDITLGAYKNLKIKKEEVKVTDEEVANEIEHLRNEFAEIKVKEDGEVETGDTAVIDFKGFVDGKELDGASGVNYPLEIGSNMFIHGFEDAIIGMKVDETKSIDLKFPDDYTPDLAGKKVKFDITLKEIKTRIIPEIDEDFFEDLGYEKVTNEKELKEEVKKILTERKEQDNDDKYLDEILNKASNNMKVEIYEEIIHDEIHRLMSQFEEQLKMQNLTLDQYLEYTKMTKDDLHKNMEPEAIKRIKYRFLLEEVAEKENIEVTEEEADKDAEEMAKNYGITKEELMKAFGSKEVLMYDAKMRKTLDFLKNN